MAKITIETDRALFLADLGMPEITMHGRCFPSGAAVHHPPPLKPDELQARILNAFICTMLAGPYEYEALVCTLANKLAVAQSTVIGWATDASDLKPEMADQIISCLRWHLLLICGDSVEGRVGRRARP